MGIAHGGLTQIRVCWREAECKVHVLTYAVMSLEQQELT
jgi:hypothetical protein